MLFYLYKKQIGKNYRHYSNCTALQLSTITPNLAPSSLLYPIEPAYFLSSNLFSVYTIISIKPFLNLNLQVKRKRIIT